MSADRKSLTVHLKLLEEKIVKMISLLKDTTASRDHYLRCMQIANTDLLAHGIEVSALRTEIAELRKALLPFVAEANRIDPVVRAEDQTIGDSCEIWQCGSAWQTRSRITYGALRFARFVHSKTGKNQKPVAAQEVINVACI